jgi:hypothetical protein
MNIFGEFTHDDFLELLCALGLTQDEAEFVDKACLGYASFRFGSEGDGALTDEEFIAELQKSKLAPTEQGHIYRLIKHFLDNNTSKLPARSMEN